MIASKMKKMNPYGKTREELLEEISRTNPDYYGSLEDVRKEMKGKSKETIILKIHAFNDAKEHMEERRGTDMAFKILVAGSILGGILATISNLKK